MRGLNLGLGLGKPKSPSGAAGPTLLSSISGLNVEFEIGAALSASYPGTGTTVFNVVENPTTGAAQSIYDFSMFGSPTFVGTAGQAGAHFLLDGSSGLYLPDVTGLMNTANQTGGAGAPGPVWVVGSFYIVDDASTAIVMGPRYVGSSYGWNIQKGSSGNYTFVYRDSVNQKTITLESGTTTANVFFAITWDATSPGSEKYWYQSPTGVSWTFSPDTAETPTGAGMSHSFGSANRASIKAMANGSKLYDHAAGTGILTDEQAAAIISILEARNGVDFTP